MIDLTIGNVRFSDPPSGGRLLESLSGWFDGVAVTSSRLERPAQHGTFAVPARRAGRLVQAGLVVLCGSAAQAGEAQDWFTGILADGGFGDLRVSDPAGRVTTASVQLASQPLVRWLPHTHTVRAQLELYAPDPLRYGDPVSAQTSFPDLRGGLRYDLYTSGTSTETTVRTNLATNPRPTGSTTGWFAGANATADLVTDEGAPAVEVANTTSNSPYVYAGGVNLTPAPAVGQWVALGVDVKPLTSDAAAAMRLYLRTQAGGTNLDGSYGSAVGSAGVWQRHVHAIQAVTAGADNIDAFVWPNVLAPGTHYRARRVVVAVADTEAEARAIVADFFDGDTPSTPTTTYAWTGSATASSSTEATTVSVGTVTGWLDYGEASTTGRVVLTNPGTADVPVLLQVEGPVTASGFEVIEVGTGRRLVFEGPVAAGSLLVMDGATGAVVLDGSSDRAGQLTWRDWPTVPRGGSTELAFIPRGTRTDATMTAVMRPGWW